MSNTRRVQNNRDPFKIGNGKRRLKTRRAAPTPRRRAKKLESTERLKASEKATREMNIHSARTRSQVRPPMRPSHYLFSTDIILAGSTIGAASVICNLSFT